MQTVASKSGVQAPRRSRRPTRNPTSPSASIPDTLAALHVNPDTGLTHAEVDTRRKEHGYNEVAEKKEHPVLKFLGNSGDSRRGCSN